MGNFCCGAFLRTIGITKKNILIMFSILFMVGFSHSFYIFMKTPEWYSPYYKTRIEYVQFGPEIVSTYRLGTNLIVPVIPASIYIHKAIIVGVTTLLCEVMALITLFGFIEITKNYYKRKRRTYLLLKKQCKKHC